MPIWKVESVFELVHGAFLLRLCYSRVFVLKVFILSSLKRINAVDSASAVVALSAITLMVFSLETVLPVVGLIMCPSCSFSKR